MLKHASICQTKRAQQALGAGWDLANSPAPDDTILEALRAAVNIDGYAIETAQRARVDETNTDNAQDILSSLTSANWPLGVRHALKTTSCSSSPTPSLQSTSISRIGSLSSAPSSVFNSPSKLKPSPLSATKCGGTSSTIKVYAQTLGQEVEYLTLPVNAQTQSRHIIRALLKKFRLKHRDPNLFYLTLERWIRKDGLRHKSVMLLADEACPLQLQQCCSNPPHNDIKFTLQVKAGALVKIFCQDVCPSTKYKCLSLSAQTTVAETIELMLYCLDLLNPPDSKKSELCERNPAFNSQTRHANSPDSASSSSSSTSSSSGIESDPTSNQMSYSAQSTTQNSTSCHGLETSSRTGSVASISSASDLFNVSSCSSAGETFCLLIECANTDYKRVLKSDEYLVDVYQNLIDEVREQPNLQAAGSNKEKFLSSIKSVNSASSLITQQSDQWFVIKLKRREELSHQSLKFTNPRQNMPLPPIPLSLAQVNNANHIQNFVSTTQIEVNKQHHRPSSSLAIISIAAHKSAIDGASGHGTGALTTASQVEPAHCHQRHMSAIVNGNSNCESKVQPPPARLIWMPQVKPRRRNLTNASSTFGAQNAGAASAGIPCNRRRYDPAQLAEDLNQLDLAGADADGPPPSSTAPISDEPHSKS